ncbi:MAG: flippase-like domain-containing protein [Chitinophagaceae bacterium]|nr:MAG: flippase-like domain-containing protein [Chitinophagaceae bacterium]
MRKRLGSILQYIIFLGGGIFLVWWQLRSMTVAEKSEFNNALWSVNYWLMIPVLLMSLLSHLSRSMRWKLLMEPLGYNPALKNVFASTMVGYFANSAIPRLGEVLKCTLLVRYEKLKFDKLFGTILVERAFDFLCYLIFIGITILMQIDLIGNYVTQKLKRVGNDSAWPIWLKIVLIIGGLLLIILGLKWLTKTFPDNKIISRTGKFLKGIGAGFASIKNLRHKRMFLMHTLIIWSLYMLQIYIGFSAMEGTAHLNIQAAFSVLSLATLAMIATPGGIGSFPIFVMETLLIYSIASPLGKAFGWLIWGANTAIVIVAGLISLILLPYMNRKKVAAQNVH